MRSEADPPRQLKVYIVYVVEWFAYRQYGPKTLAQVGPTSALQAGKH